MSENVTINVADLGTEEGVCEASVQMAAAVCRQILWPVMERTPKEMRQAMFERFLCGLTGALCAEVGPERAKETLDAVKLAIEDLQANRGAAH